MYHAAPSRATHCGSRYIRGLALAAQSRRLSPRRHHHVFAEISTNTASQTFISTSSDPYLNLSIEHYLLTHCHPASSILFLYINAPCVVIGRNQNPWLEVNLRGLKERPALSTLPEDNRQLLVSTGNSGDVLQEVEIVRRRSGGGTVFHDAGNLNYCTITPRAVFNRDRSAMMVARALHALSDTISTHIKFQGGNIRVNERHDIVMDMYNASQDLTDSAGAGPTPTVKISGSAYKLTSSRALHHGTLLLGSPNLKTIGFYLRSAARPYIQAKGVESVRSNVGNVLDLEGQGIEEAQSSIQSVMQAIIREFRLMTDPQQSSSRLADEWKDAKHIGSEVAHGKNTVAEKINTGMKELRVSYLCVSRFSPCQKTFNH